ncbi:MAG: DUF167 domain-containing protein [Acidobacteriaceae bacterium]
MLPVRDSPEGARFFVRVTPRASRTAILGTIGEGSGTALRIALHAPPIEGRANAALNEFLSDLLSVRRSDIEITGGRHARNKTVLIRGRDATQIASAVDQALAQPGQSNSREPVI